MELKVHKKVTETKQYYKEKAKYEKLLTLLFKDKYLWHKAYFRSPTHKLKVCCRSHGFFWISPIELVKKAKTKHQCPHCERIRLKFIGERQINSHKLYKGVYFTSKLFKEICIKTNGHIYDYSNVIFKGFNNPIYPVCPVHGKVKIKYPSTQLTPTSCKACRGSAKRFTTQEFVEKVKVTHNDIYDYSKTNYVSARDVITITCPIHGDFETVAGAHRVGHGCPSCFPGGYNPKKPGIFYYLKVNNGEAYKIGITNLSVKERYCKSDLDKSEVLLEEYYENGYEARQREKYFLNKYKDLKYKGANLLKSAGIFELFQENILEIEGVLNTP